LEFGIPRISCTFAPPNLNDHEKNIPAICQKTQEQARVQGKNVDQERQKGIVKQTGYRKKEADRFRRKALISCFSLRY
jgi:hypothetical protein